MENNQSNPLRSITLVLPAALFGAAAVAGLWLWQAQGDQLQALVASGVLGVIALFGIMWQSRARSASRLQAVLDAYVARELARASAVASGRRVN
jgi:hypothetical protein